jgi:beta-lactamase superfamily II metal-dependent hydrolase
MNWRTVSAPPEGDCFFHVVAHFEGDHIRDVAAARDLRQQVARAAAQALFQAPYNNLATLTDLVLNSTQALDLNVVQLRVTQASQDLQQDFQNGPDQDQGNGGGCPLAAWVVWLQYSYREIQQLRKGQEAPWLRVGHNFLAYTLWGDGLFSKRLVEQITGKEARFYTPDTVGDVDEVEDDVINFYFSENHFDAVEFFEEEDDEGGGANGSFPEGPLPHSKNLRVEIHHLDVAQGDSTLILVWNGGQILQSALIDGGDAGQARLIHEYMARVGVKLLHWIVITHYDADHCRGIFELLTQSNICSNARIFDRGDPEDYDLQKKLSEEALSKDTEGTWAILVDEDEDPVEELFLMFKKTKRTRTTAGMSGRKMLGAKLFEIGGGKEEPLISLQCIAANGYVLGGTYVPPLHSDRENARSLALLLRFNGFVYYFGGDAPGTPQNDLEGAIGKYLMGTLGLDHVCGFKASHHGSHHSTSPDFVDAIRPTAAFVSCGDHLKHQHPRQEALDSIQNGITVQNGYLTRCAFRRDHITPHGKFQDGKLRVAGDERTLGTIVLRVDHSMVGYHVFHVGYWDRELATWRVQRHSCLLEDVSEEVGFRQEEPEDLAITSCHEQAPAEALEQEVLLADAIERSRAERDSEIVRSFKVERNAKRAFLEGTESAEKPEPKTVETEEMLMELDEKYDKEMEDNEQRASDDDSDYVADLD